MMEGPNPSGLCWCKCGQKTELAANNSNGNMKGQPQRWVFGHWQGRKRAPGGGRPREIFGPAPNPSGLCWCGCGQTTPIASRSVRRTGQIKGEHVRYIVGHVRRGKPRPAGSGSKPMSLEWEVDPATGCGVLPESRRPPGTRVSISVGGDREDLAYRVIYAREVGPIPAGYHLHHTCENPSCVNPAHLEPLTPAEHRKRHAKAA